MRQPGQHLPGGDAVALFGEDLDKGQAFHLRGHQHLLPRHQRTDQHGALGDRALGGRGDGDRGWPGLGRLRRQRQQQQRQDGPQEPAQQQLQHRPEPGGGERRVQPLMDAKPVPERHDELQRGIDIERGIHEPARLPPRQRRPEVAPRLAVQPLEHASDLGIARRLGHGLGRQRRGGPGQQPLQRIEPNAGQRLHRILGFGHFFKERCMLRPLRLGDGGDDGDLARKIPIDRTGAHAGLRADFLHGGAVKPGAREAV